MCDASPSDRKEIRRRNTTFNEYSDLRKFVHGNGVEENLVEAYKWFSLSETAIGKHFIKIISEDMSDKEIVEAKKLIKSFKPTYD